jgi:quercetin dioxygenase-like cupin family protein
MNEKENRIPIQRYGSIEEALYALTALDQDYVLVRHRLTKGKVIKEHHHPLANEWVLIDNGTIEVTINGITESFEFNGNPSVISFPAGSKHALIAISETEYTVLRDREDEILYSE